LPLCQPALDAAAMQNEEVTPHAPRQQDVAALIGLLVKLHGELYDRDGPVEAVPEWAQRFAARLSRDGLLAPTANGQQLRQCLSDLSHRLRYVLGEYETPPAPSPVP
jgi:hypothetical protein